MRIGKVGVALATVLTVAGCAPASTATTLPAKSAASAEPGVSSPSPIDDVVPTKILDTLREWQAQGTRIDGRIEWIQTTANSVLPILPDLTITPDVPIYVLQMHGHFFVQTTGGPPGATAPPVPFIDGTAVITVAVGKSPIGAGGRRVTRGQNDVNLESVAPVHSFSLTPGS